jgi:hypothetical protein
MQKKYGLIFLTAILFVLTGCAGTSNMGGATEPRAGGPDKQRVLDLQVYEPYKIRDTIEEYKAFISGHPGNFFIEDARRQIHRLEFAGYLKRNTESGYREFLKKNPDSPYARDAMRKIEGIEFRRVQKADTVDEYKKFIERYPGSYHADDARLFIQEAKFNGLDKKLGKKYGFDLLMYRLTLKRLRRDLVLDKKNKLAAFKCSADFGVHEGKTYFRTHLIYKKGALPHTRMSPGNTPDAFDAVISKALVYLQRNFKRKKQVAGFAFTLSASDIGLYRPEMITTEYYFDKKNVALYSRKIIAKKELMEQCLTVYPSERLVRKKKSGTPRPKGPAPGIDIGLMASKGTFKDTILLMWTPYASEREYQVYRSGAMDKDYTPVSGKLRGTLFYDRDVKAGKAYYYKIRGYFLNQKKGWSSIPVKGRAAVNGLNGPDIVQGAPLTRGLYIAKPEQRQSPIYEFRKNGTCMERTYNLRLDGTWAYEGDTLVIKAGKFDHHYTFDLTERWKDAFTTHNGKRFHRMGLKQVVSTGNEALKFTGSGYIRAVGTGFAKTNDDYPFTATVTMNKKGKWHVGYVLGGRKVESTTVPIPVPAKGRFELVEFKGNYYLSMPESGPGYFRQ